MPRTAPAQPPTGLHKLPQELLKHIVVLVDQQDKAVRESDVPLAEAAPRAAPYAGEAQLAGGKWCFWYGHGVSALSLVSKCLRRVAISFVCQTVTAKQLAAPIFFQHEAIPPEMRAGITRLDLCGATADSLAAAAFALPSLPRLRAVEYDMGVFTEVKAACRAERNRLAPAAAASHEFILSAFKALAERCTDVQIWRFGLGAAYDDAVDELAMLASLKSLRRLDIRLRRERDKPQGRGLLDVLGMLGKLEELVVAASDSHKSIEDELPAPLWEGSAMMPMLRSLTLDGVDSVDALTFASRCAPNLECLDITADRYADVHDPAETQPVLSFPLPLLVVVLGLGDLSEDTYVEDVIPPRVVLPAGLNLHLELHPFIPACGLDTIKDGCQHCHVRLTYERLERLAAFLPPYSLAEEAPQAESGELYERLEQVDKALIWARKRLSEAWDEGDVKGLIELAEATRPLGERRLLAQL